MKMAFLGISIKCGVSHAPLQKIMILLPFEHKIIYKMMMSIFAFASANYSEPLKITSL